VFDPERPGWALAKQPQKRHVTIASTGMSAQFGAGTRFFNELQNFMRRYDAAATLEQLLFIPLKTKLTY
jgi:hypothetical protein